MSLYETVLSLHILAAIFGFGVAAVAHTSLFRLRSVTDGQQLRVHLPVLERVGPLFPVSAVLLFVFGAELIHLAPHQKFHWGDGWVVTAIVSLVVVEAVGGGVIGRRVKAIVEELGSVPDGPISEETRARVTDRSVWLASHFTTAVIASIVFVMVGKPSGGGAIAIVVIGALVGLASAVPFLSPKAAAAAV